MSSSNLQKSTFKVKGMHCASCANVIASSLNKIEGVRQAESFYATEEAVIDFDTKATNFAEMNQALKKFGYELMEQSSIANVKPTGRKIDPAYLELKMLKSKIALTMPVAIFVLLAMIWELAVRRFAMMPAFPLFEEIWMFVQLVLSTFTIILLGQPFLQALPRFVRFGKANMDTLVGLGTSVAYLYSVFALFFFREFQQWGLSTLLYFDATIIVITFVRFGKYLESRSKLRTGEALSSLMQLQARTAWLQQGKKFVEIAIEQVQIGDVLQIKPGASMPVDGVISSGEANVDESMLTGEALPLRKSVGEQVVAGTINLDGILLIKAVKVGQDTMLAKIIEMVKNAQNSKAPIERLADQVSAWFVPTVLSIAILTLLIWLWLGSVALAISCMIAVLVIACPCSLGLATPTAMIVGVGAAAKQGILIKNAESLERLHQVTTVIFDKTGTLTSGRPSVSQVLSASQLTEDGILSLAMSLEQNSEHPLAQAVVKFATAKHLHFKKVEQFHNLVGEGVTGRISNHSYTLLSQSSTAKRYPISLSLQQALDDSESALYLLDENGILGMIAVADQLKPTSQAAVAGLQRLGIKQILLSGDRQQVVDGIAAQLGVKQAFGELAPAGKLSYIKKLQQQGEIVAMVGDGINDAPALAAADVGIAMSSGTEVAMSTAAATILHGDLLKVEIAIGLSKSVMHVVKENLFWAFAYNVLGIPLAAGVFYFTFGWLLNPAFAGIAMAFSSVSVVVNSLRLKWILR